MTDLASLNLSLARTVAVEGLRRLVADYCAELDASGGRHVARFLTHDCRMDIGNMQLRGHEQINQFYEDFERQVVLLGAAGRTTRHLVTNLRIDLDMADPIEGGSARIEAIMVNFSAYGRAPVPSGTVPTVISDVRLGCRRCSDGEWRIFEFTGGAIFVGNDALQNKALIQD